jgi:large subunit ribosomal protein L22
MTGPKLNEKNFVAGERSGTKASAKYVRSSARKARVVLDLIRDLDVTRADQVLQFTERDIARTIRKVLASAVANASDTTNGAYLGDPEELYVKACFADEGPTLRRFRPRARGRATRIRKRTCHITIVLDRMSDEQMRVVQAKAERGGSRAAGTAAGRRARVEASRKRAQARKGGAADGTVTEDTATEELTDQVELDEVLADDVETTTEAVETEAVEETEATEAEPVEETADEAAAETTEDTTDEADGDDDAEETK